MNNKLISNNKTFLTAAILISIIGAGILGYWQYRNAFLPKISPIVSISPTAFSSPASMPTPAITPHPEVWETYTNSELGFSIKYPQMVYGVYRCEPHKPFYVPVKVFENNKNGITYITQEYYYEAPYDGELSKYTEPCEKIINSLGLLTKKNEENEYIKNKPFLGWAILMRSIKNDIELNSFIKDSYGSGCYAEKKELWKQQDGVYEIIIKGEDWNKEGDTTTCPFNYPHKILYAPKKNKLMSVIFGQDECDFTTNPNPQSFKCYDDEMIDSFRFK